MRALVASALLLGAGPGSVYAEVSLGASIGAGAQGAATYGALDLRLDASWPDANVRLGIGARGVWDDTVFRRTDWNGLASVLTIVRDFEVARVVGGTKLAFAAGALAPARLGHIVDGYRVALDDKFRTGMRAFAEREHLDVALEVDDVNDPVEIGAALRYAMSPPYAVHFALAADPSAPALAGKRTVTTIEAGIGRRYEAGRARADVGVSVVAEIGLGASAVAFGQGVIERGGVTWTARADARAGSGSAGALFGALYRIERVAHDGRRGLWDRARDGELGGASTGARVGAAVPAGWLELGARTRPGLGGLGFASAGAPMGRWVQAGMWMAVARDDAAGAAELRVAWAKQRFSSLQVARMYRFDSMEPISLWSVTAWFGAASE